MAGQIDEIKIIKTSDPLSREKQHMQNSSDISLRENFYIDCQKYYEREFGFPLLSIPEELLSNKDFKKITVERAMNIFQMFNLIPKDTGLFYYALLYDSLPMPPDIIEVKNETSCEYHFNGNSVRDVLRPTYFYVKEVLEHLKDKTHQAKNRVEEFKLFDSLGRPYKVNLKKVFHEYLTYPDHRDLINYTQQTESRAAAVVSLQSAEKSKLTYAEKYKMENLKRMREIMGKNYSIELTSEMNSSSPR